MSDIAIKVEGISKKYILGHKHSSTISERFQSMFSRNNAEKEEFWALKDISLEVKKGEAVGIVGKNGAGKSTLLKVLSRITHPTHGRFELNGRVSSLLEVGTGFHPELTGRDNIFLNGTILGMSRNEIRSKFDEIVEFSGVSKFLDTPVKHYSSGMYVRLAFSVAAHLEPEILIIDEVLAVGDAEFQKKCLGKMDEVAKQGRTVLFVSHNMAAVGLLCQKGIMLNKGEVHLVGEIDDIVKEYSVFQSSVNFNNYINQEVLELSKVDGFALKHVKIDNLSNPDSLISSGDDVRFSFFYQADKKFLSPAFALIFRDQMGVEVFRLSTKPISGYEIDLFNGLGCVSLEIRKLPLVKGSYFVDFGFVRERMEWIIKSELLIQLEVQGKDVYGSGLILDRSRGFIWVDHNWEHSNESL